MEYTLEDVATKNDTILTGLVAEFIMGEPKPDYSVSHDDGAGLAYSNGGWWICRPHWNGNDKCDWFPVSFVNSLRWAWQIVEVMNQQPDNLRKQFHHWLNELYPFGANNEAEACRTICRAALLARMNLIKDEQMKK